MKNTDVALEMTNELMIGWTTVETEAQATRLARELLEAKLVACVQVELGITAHYVWEGKTTQAQEIRLTLKFSSEKAEAIKQWLKEHHPYVTPQWVAVNVQDSLEDYRKWVLNSC